jgi:hypothetical protein
MAKKEITSGIDAANRLVEIGDTVAFMEARGQSGQDILVAKVVGFSPKKIRLAYKRHAWWRDDQSETVTKYPHQCIRIDYKPADLVLALKHSDA